MRHLSWLASVLFLAGCYTGLQVPSSGPRAQLILAPTEQQTDQKHPPGIYVYKHPENCAGIQRPGYPAADPASGERPYTIPAGVPIAIGWHSDLTGRVRLGVTPSGVVVPTGRGSLQMCSNTLLFTPAEGETYRVSDPRVSDGCRYELTDSAGRACAPGDVARGQEGRLALRARAGIIGPGRHFTPLNPGATPSLAFNRPSDTLRAPLARPMRPPSAPSP